MVVPLVLLTVTVDVRWGLAAAIGGALAARGSRLRRGLVLAVAAIALGLAWEHTTEAALFAAHAHNFVALALWLAWRRRATWMHLLPLVGFVAGCIAILSGALDPIVAALGGWSATPGEHSAFGSTGLWYHLASIAPGIASRTKTRRPAKARSTSSPMKYVEKTSNVAMRTGGRACSSPRATLSSSSTCARIRFARS